MNIQNHNQMSVAKLSSTVFPVSYNVNKIFFTLIFSVYLSLSLICFIWPNNFITLFNTLLGLFALIILSFRIKREYVPIYIFVGLLVTSFLVSSLFVWRTGWRFYFPICFLVSSPGIAMIMLRGYVYSWGGYIVFYSLSAYFLILMLAGVDGYSALKYSSWNGISTLMLVACISLYIILSLEKKYIDLKPALITLVISIWGIGRSGIVSSFVLLLGILFVRLRDKPKYIYYVIYCFIIACVFYIFFSLVMDYDMLANAIDHYLTRKTESGPSERLNMWTNYFYNIDIFRLLFGVNIVEDPWPEGEIFEYNIHNSFINLHLQTGFMGLFTIALIIFAFFKFYRTNQVFLILLLTIVLRSSTDLLIFFGPFDFVPFFFIFYFIKSSHFRIPHINFVSSGIKKHGSHNGLS
jgi:hypothetical protein